MASPLRVLVVDDDAIARELLVSTLEKAGHQLFELSSAIGATRLIHERSIDAVVIDVMMPAISGDKLARLLRHNARGPKLAIILVSSRPREELERLAKAANADEVVSKRDIHTGLNPAVMAAHLKRSRPTPRSRPSQSPAG